MKDAQRLVAAFHDKYGFTRAQQLQVPTWETRLQRLKLLREELDELEEAFRNDDLKESVDAVADLAYVVVGTAVAMGLNLELAFLEVHNSNMSKQVIPGELKPGKDKAAGYREPNIEKVIELHGRA